MDLYDVASRTITRTGGTGHFNYECGASRDGSLFALPTYYGTFVYDRTFNQVTNIGVYAGQQPIGTAFHPAADAVFFPFADTSYVRAYSTTTWEMLAEYDIAGGNTARNTSIAVNALDQVAIAWDQHMVASTTSMHHVWTVEDL